MYNNSKKRSCGLLFSGLLLISAVPAHAASVSASSAVLYDEGWSGLTQINGTPGNVSTVSYTNVNGLAAGAYGQASFGALYASASSVAAGDHTQTRGQGSANWAAVLTFSDLALTGTTAYAHASFHLNGGLASYSDPLSVGALGNSTVGASIFVGGTKVFEVLGQLTSRNGTIITDDKRLGLAVNGVYQMDPTNSLSGTFSFDIPFTFGTPFLMNASLTAFTQALASAPGDLASAYSNFGSSGYWGGIGDVHLADGTVLSGYSLSSDSDFDWSNAYPAASPVPVPAAMWLFGLGLLGLIGFARRTPGA
ncbi:MAG TPA: PEP-CTERM sorting domain-containing protein [Gammaproteobacteria bacterium]|nr:PEP-CTERM sorting domain-containing protein [Gammaproteobacteria bacterium]